MNAAALPWQTKRPAIGSFRTLVRVGGDEFLPHATHAGAGPKPGRPPIAAGAVGAFGPLLHGTEQRFTLLGRAEITAAADWLERRPQLGRNELRRGRSERRSQPRGAEIIDLLRARLVAL